MDIQKDICGQRWYVIHTLPKQEDRAESNLIAWGIETFNPKMRARRYNKFTGQPTFFSKSVFSNYIFARFDATTMLGKINFTRGVRCIVNFGNGPVAVDDEIIHLLQMQVGPDNLIRLEEGLKCNDRVQIKSGAFKNLTGIFTRATKPFQRVLLLLSAVSY